MNVTATGTTNEYTARVVANGPIGDDTRITTNAGDGFMLVGDYSVSNCLDSVRGSAIIVCRDSKELMVMAFTFNLTKAPAPGQVFGAAQVKGPGGAVVNLELKGPS